MKKVFVVGGSFHYSKWIKNSELTENLEEADIVIFTGGEDVDPSLYKEPNVASYSNILRDLEEVSIFKEAASLKKNIIGICRGSQFLTVMNGGKLIQDVKGHATGQMHPILIEKENVVLNVTSTHHQMMNPFNLEKSDYDIIGKSFKSISPYYKTGYEELKSLPCEPEIVYYHKNKCLAIQPHPEMMSNDSHFVIYLNKLISDLF